MLISPEEINKSLSSKNWKYFDKKINKTFKFTKYMESIDFVQKVAILAEKNNHHPDINIAWCTINISITSHELGGVSTKCINLASGIDFLLQ
tara:strand:- start:3832 stop:4107 length:276 start_codon:yes stop_codon:yes gene_type:complete